MGAVHLGFEKRSCRPAPIATRPHCSPSSPRTVPPGCATSVAKTTHAIEYELCGQLESDTTYGPCPGLTPAAFDSPNPEMPRPRTAGETVGFTVIARLGCVDPA